ncbi:ABC transporter permease [Nannocystaceae bacterium ST9]
MGFALQVAARMLRREGRAPSWARAARALGLGVAIVGALVLGSSDAGPVWLLGLAWLAGLIGVIAALVCWLRPLLVVAVFGLALGVASLFVVLGVASGVEQALIRSMARLNGHAMISKYGLDFFEYDQVASTLVADPRIRAASPFVFGVGMAVVVPAEPDAEAESEPLIVTIKGVDPRRASQLSGIAELFAEGDLVGSLRPAGPREPAGIVLGTRLAARLGVGLGDRLRVVVPEAIHADSGVGDRPRHGEFEVLGLLDTGFAEFDATLVLVHITAAQALVFGEMRASGIELELEQPRIGAALAIADELAAKLDEPRTSVGRLPWFRADSWFERSEQLTVIRQVKALLVVVLGLIVVVASSSLVAALLVLIRGKRRHIGVFAALGARRSQVFWCFEWVGLAAGLIGAGTGLLLGGFTLLLLDWARFGLDPEVYMVDRLPVAFVGVDMVIPTLIALFVCGLVSGPVARQASGLRPLESITFGD